MRSRGPDSSHYHENLHPLPRLFSQFWNPTLATLTRHSPSLVFSKKSFHKEVFDYLYSEAVFNLRDDIEALLFHPAPELADLIKEIR